MVQELITEIKELQVCSRNWYTSSGCWVIVISLLNFAYHVSNSGTITDYLIKLFGWEFLVCVATLPFLYMADRVDSKIRKKGKSIYEALYYDNIELPNEDRLELAKIACELSDENPFTQITLLISQLRSH